MGFVAPVWNLNQKSCGFCSVFSWSKVGFPPKNGRSWDSRCDKVVWRSTPTSTTFHLWLGMTSLGLEIPTKLWTIFRCSRKKWDWNLLADICWRMIQQPLLKRDSEIDRNLKWKTYISYRFMICIRIFTHTHSHYKIYQDFMSWDTWSFSVFHLQLAQVLILDDSGSMSISSNPTARRSLFEARCRRHRWDG